MLRKIQAFCYPYKLYQFIVPETGYEKAKSGPLEIAWNVCINTLWRPARVWDIGSALITND
jgi:hypothetical protein